MAEISPFSVLTPGMVCVSNSCFFLGQAERVGVAGNVLFAVFWPFVWELISSDNKALTNEESRCQARASVMNALVTKSSSK